MPATRHFRAVSLCVVVRGIRRQGEGVPGLERAYQARSYLLVEYLNTDQRLDGLRDDPQFAALRQRTGLQGATVSCPGIFTAASMAVPGCMLCPLVAARIPLALNGFDDVVNSLAP